MGKLKDFFMDFLDIIYPKKQQCLFCGASLKKNNDYGLCSNCMALLPFLPDNTCRKCGRPLPEGYTKYECEECKGRVMYFDGASSVFEYSGIAQSAIYKFKFDGDREVARPLGKFMAAKLEQKSWDIDCIMPVPLHKERLSERGFNQSYLLSLEIGREREIDVLDGILVRQRPTASQVSLERTGRINNVKGAFAIGNEACVKGKSILIIDDVMTTGSTINECSRALREHGAKYIYCLTAACPYYSK